MGIILDKVKACEKEEGKTLKGFGVKEDDLKNAFAYIDSLVDTMGKISGMLYEIRQSLNDLEDAQAVSNKHPEFAIQKWKDALAKTEENEGKIKEALESLPKL
ncbi:hypothetical protein ACFLZN_00190 [Nanoarchaeota archaeon]